MNEILIYDTIGEGASTVSNVRKQLSTMAGDVVVRISSPGGDAHQGVAIMNALRGHDGNVTTIIEGLAASAASYIAIGGGRRVVMAPHSELMIHEAAQQGAGNASVFTKLASGLDRISNNIASIYATKAGGTTKQWRELMKDETWFSAEEALAAGLVDAIDNTVVTPPAAAQNIYAHLNQYRYAGRDNAPAPKLPQPRKEHLMGLFDRTPRNEDTASQGITFTTEQWHRLLSTLNLEADTAGPEEVIAAVDQLANSTKKDFEEAAENYAHQTILNTTARNAREGSITVDRKVCNDMQDYIRRGVNTTVQENRLEAEQVVDQAIRIGKAGPGRREQWIKSYLDDRERTLKALNNAAEIPRVEIGHSLSMEQLDSRQQGEGKGWVR